MVGRVTPCAPFSEYADRRAEDCPPYRARDTLSFRSSRKPHVFARIHLEIQHQRILRIGLDDFLHEFYVDRVFSEHGELIHRLKIDGDEEWPVGFRVDSLAAFDAEHLGNFQELHPRVHHHLLHPGWGDLVLQSVENDMVNHEGKANRRFQRAVQVRIRCPGSVFKERRSLVCRRTYLSSNWCASCWPKSVTKHFMEGYSKPARTMI